MNKYKCSHCGKTTLRDSNKKWILSWCDAKGRYTRITLQTLKTNNNGTTRN